MPELHLTQAQTNSLLYRSPNQDIYNRFCNDALGLADKRRTVKFNDELN